MDQPRAIDLSQKALSELDYSSVKAVIELRPVVKNGRCSFIPAMKMTACAMADAGHGSSIPCFKSKKEITRGAWAESYFHEQVLVRGDFGTTFAVPKILQPDALGKFTRIPGPHPAFEGYFGSEFKVRRAYAKVLLPELLNRVLPFERVNDSELESALRGLFRESEGED